MLHVLKVPKWGLSMERAEVRSWAVEEGAAVAVGTGLVEIESEKIANEVESEFAGILRRILAPVGSQVAVGEPLAILANEDESDDEIATYAQLLTSNKTTHQGEAKGPRRDRAQCGDYLISYLSLGDDLGRRSPVVLIHGFGGDSTTWQLTAPVLAEERLVYAPDLLGHGDSSRTLHSGTIQELGDSIIGFLQFLSIERCHLIGHSLGAAIARHIAARQPAIVESLTFLSPAGLGAAVDVDFLARFARADSRKEIKGVLLQLFKDPGIVTPELVEKVQQGKRIDGTREALERIIVGSIDANGNVISKDQADVSGSLIVVGDSDRVIRFDESTKVAAGATLKILPSIGHMPQIEASDDVNRLVSAHLSEREARSAATKT